MRSGWLVTMVLAACGGASVSVTGMRVRTVADAPSGKHATIYRSSSFTSEPRDVSEDVVIQSMRASSLFFEEDIRALAPKIAPELGKLERDQRIVVETSDTAIYMFVATGELQIVGYHDGQEVSRHASAIPAAAVKTELTPRRYPAAPAETHPAPVETRPTPPPVEVAPPPKPVETASKPVVAAPPAVTATPPRPRPRPAATPAAKPAPRLTEAEIRAKLDELEHLRAKDLITQDEYEKKKRALLDQL